MTGYDQFWVVVTELITVGYLRVTTELVAVPTKVPIPGEWLGHYIDRVFFIPSTVITILRSLNVFTSDILRTDSLHI